MLELYLRSRVVRKIFETMLQSLLGDLPTKPIALALGVSFTAPVGAAPSFRPGVIRLLGFSRHNSAYRLPYRKLGYPKLFPPMFAVS